MSGELPVDAWGAALSPERAPMQLNAYLHIVGGRCEEALKFYVSVFGGSYEASRFGDRPDDSIPANWKDKIMHSTFTGGGITFMAADTMPGNDGAVTDSNVSLTLSNNDATEGERIFNALADGGAVEVPFSKQFWGASFGMLVDRFEINWMVNSN